MSKPKRLHPIASVIQTGKRLKGFTLPGIAFIISVGRHGKEGLVGSLVISLVVVFIILFTGILSWLRFTFRFENDELRIEHGVFIRKKRYIPFERIQSIDLTEGILQRIFGLVKVQIETAGGGGGEEAEAVLSAISKEEARLIQEYVAAAKIGGAGETQFVQEGQPVFKISFGQLMILSLTSGGIGVVISAIFALLSQLDDLIPFQRLFGSFEKWAVHNLFIIAIIVFLGFFLAWLIALVMTMLKYANFTVMKTEKDFVISQGLLEKRQITIPLNRIQAIRVSETLVRRFLGCGTVTIESAGGSNANLEGANVTLLPIVKVKQIQSIIEPHLPDYIFANSFNPAPKRAMWRYILRTWYFVIPIVLVSLIFLKVWGMLSFILLALVTNWAILKYKAAGWALNKQQLSLRFQFIKRTTVFMKKNKIQSLETRESLFQRKRNLGTIEANVKSGVGAGGGSVIDLEKSDIEKIFEWYSRNKKGDCNEV
ncbi:PH domain-containing protein [Neobacillus bataviensis]|uniref:PH domain-containing protein n=1 Tax=Neobacillus bataviensis TaxID=220685 RepID=UPI001CBFF8B2|nr:PH domain-containing protein [Neobacillus bataviensis]